MGASKQPARLNNTVTDMSANLVSTRRSLMVFRARMQTVDATVSSIGAGLERANRRFGRIADEARKVAATCQETVELCDALLAARDGDKP